MKNILTKLMTIFLVLGTLSAFATPMVSSFDQRGVSWGGFYSVGYRFTSNVDTSISALGYWDDYLNGFNASHEVGLWNSTGTLLGAVTLNAGKGDTLVGEFRYASLSQSINLDAGSDYYLAGITLGDRWVYQANNMVMSSQFNFRGSYFSGNISPIELPTLQAFNREFMTVSAMVNSPVAANQVVATAVAEPGSMALWVAGLIGAGALGRRKKN